MPAVTKGRELWFLGLFLVQYVGGLALLYWRGLRTDELTLLEAAALATALIIMSTAHAVVIVEGIAMLAESFLRRRYEAGLQEGVRRAAKKAAWWAGMKASRPAAAKPSSAGKSGTGGVWQPRPGASGLRNRRPGSSGVVRNRDFWAPYQVRGDGIGGIGRFDRLARGGGGGLILPILASW